MQVPGLTTRYGRRTCALQAVAVLQAVALALGGRAGARLSGRLACAVIRSTIVRIIRSAADPDGQTPLLLGVDLRAAQGPCRWRHMIEIQTRRPVAILPERSAESFRAWLDAVPLENRIRLVTCESSECKAARVYSLIRPPRTGLRWIRSRVEVGNGGVATVVFAVGDALGDARCGLAVL